MAGCPPLATEGAFLSSLLNHIDCQGQTIGAAGYQALANPGSPIAIALTGVLTIFIALFGLRMVLGATPSLREGVLAVVKIGVVLVLATSWPAYRTVIYDVVVHGPAQLAQAVAGSSALPGAQGDLTHRLQRVDNAITRLTTLGSGRGDLTSQSPLGPNGVAAPMERAPISDDLALGSARIAFLSSITAAFALVHLGAGILLALAPLFAGLLLFDMARGLFLGWLRALIFTLLASVTLTIILGVELALLEPWLSQTLQLRAARVITAQAPIELLVLCLGFAVALAGTLGVILRLSFTTHVQFDLQKLVPWQGLVSPADSKRGSAAASGEAGPARAVAVANAVAAAQRRETASRALGASQRLHAAGATAALMPAPSTGGSAAAPLRRTKPRKSLASTLRDRQS